MLEGKAPAIEDSCVSELLEVLLGKQNSSDGPSTYCPVVLIMIASFFFFFLSLLFKAVSW